MEGKETSRRIVIILTCLMFAGCAETTTKEQPASVEYGQNVKSQGNYSAQTEAEVTCSIVDSYVLPGIKRSLVVQLDKKVSEDTLRDLAIKLKAQDPREYERTFISYILPGMKVNAGAWATTHFDPNLEIHILGSSIEQEEFFQKQTANSSQSTIGTWLYQILGASDMNRTWTIYRQNSKLYIKTTYTDGSGGTELIEEKPHSMGRFFQTKKQATDGEYFLLDSQGNLQLWDREGWIATAKKLN